MTASHLDLRHWVSIATIDITIIMLCKFCLRGCRACPPLIQVPPIFRSSLHHTRAVLKITAPSNEQCVCCHSDVARFQVANLEKQPTVETSLEACLLPMRHDAIFDVHRCVGALRLRYNHRTGLELQMHSCTCRLLVRVFAISTAGNGSTRGLGLDFGRVRAIAAHPTVSRTASGPDPHRSVRILACFSYFELLAGPLITDHAFPARHNPMTPHEFCWIK
ncbi:hypothetical protein BXZ70DRAFT_904118 [Cristinia sonorae]|uniref:Uncharacterized protein n=1 Tax=Cristinia sonorae TaxID=1940300 RepID=A0A8K0UYB5_9AGAR|nr:hypothetical protein BXZ70DRAFT_904118 [Cristinia sonorae]